MPDFNLGVPPGGTGYGSDAPTDPQHPTQVAPAPKPHVQQSAFKPRKKPKESARSAEERRIDATLGGASGSWAEPAAAPGPTVGMERYGSSAVPPEQPVMRGQVGRGPVGLEAPGDRAKYHRQRLIAEYVENPDLPMTGLAAKDQRMVRQLRKEGLAVQDKYTAQAAAIHGKGYGATPAGLRETIGDVAAAVAGPPIQPEVLQRAARAVRRQPRLTQAEQDELAYGPASKLQGRVERTVGHGVEQAVQLGQAFAGTRVGGGRTPPDVIGPGGGPDEPPGGRGGRAPLPETPLTPQQMAEVKAVGGRQAPVPETAPSRPRASVERQRRVQEQTNGTIQKPPPTRKDEPPTEMERDQARKLAQQRDAARQKKEIPTPPPSSALDQAAAVVRAAKRRAEGVESTKIPVEPVKKKETPQGPPAGGKQQVRYQRETVDGKDVFTARDKSSGKIIDSEPASTGKDPFNVLKKRVKEAGGVTRGGSPPRGSGQTPREKGTSPRQQGTSPRQKKAAQKAVDDVQRAAGGKGETTIKTGKGETATSKGTPPPEAPPEAPPAKKGPRKPKGGGTAQEAEKPKTRKQAAGEDLSSLLQRSIEAQRKKGDEPGISAAVERQRQQVRREMRTVDAQMRKRAGPYAPHPDHPSQEWIDEIIRQWEKQYPHSYWRVSERKRLLTFLEKELGAPQQEGWENRRAAARKQAETYAVSQLRDERDRRKKRRPPSP